MFSRKRLRDLRESLELTRQELSDATNISQSTLYMWERGTSAPIFLGRAAQLCALFGESVQRVCDCPAIWIRRGRYRLGMTQKELAAALGISEAVVSRWELGTDPLKSLIHLRNLCWELNCELDYFIED